MRNTSKAHSNGCFAKKFCGSAIVTANVKGRDRSGNKRDDSMPAACGEYDDRFGLPYLESAS